MGTADAGKPVSTVLEDAGIDLDKLQEIPLPSDPEEQALERAKSEMLHTLMARWMDARALVRRFAPVLLQCGFCEHYFVDRAMSFKVVRALTLAIPGPVAIVGSPACATDVRRPVKEWIDLAKSRRES